MAGETSLFVKHIKKYFAFPSQTVLLICLIKCPVPGEDLVPIVWLMTAEKASKTTFLHPSAITPKLWS